MKKEIYMIIDANPDGDSYEIHTDLKEAHKAFKEKKKSKSDIILGEGTLYLIHVENPKDFGFGGYGDVYGGEVIEEFTTTE